jgi:hypothetical protein
MSYHIKVKQAAAISTNSKRGHMERYHQWTKVTLNCIVTKKP